MLCQLVGWGYCSVDAEGSGEEVRSAGGVESGR